MHLSPFEIIMLLCFGSSWPFSIYRVWRSKTASGKSIVFLVLVMIGYSAGILHKIFFNPDFVVALYALNLVMVGTDLVLCLYYRTTPMAKPLPRPVEKRT